MFTVDGRRVTINRLNIFKPRNVSRALKFVTIAETRWKWKPISFAFDTWQKWREPVSYWFAAAWSNRTGTETTSLRKRKRFWNGRWHVLPKIHSAASSHKTTVPKLILDNYAIPGSYHNDTYNHSYKGVRDNFWRYNPYLSGMFVIAVRNSQRGKKRQSR